MLNGILLWGKYGMSLDEDRNFILWLPWDKFELSSQKVENKGEASEILRWPAHIRPKGKLFWVIFSKRKIKPKSWIMSSTLSKQLRVPQQIYVLLFIFHFYHDPSDAYKTLVCLIKAGLFCRKGTYPLKNLHWKAGEF